MITITAASSQFGRVVLDELLTRGTPAQDIVATTRDISKLDDFAARGVQVRHADYDDSASLDAAFADVDRLLLISSGSMGQLPQHHANAINAAKKAGASEIVYTSFLNADTSGMVMAQPHAETEQLIRESGIPFAILRNGNYIENYAGFVGFWTQYQSAVGAAGDGKISGVSRTDLAIAAAVVISGDPVKGETYDLAGPAFTMQGLVDIAAELSGTAITYNNLPEEEYAKVLVSGGLPEFVAAGVADINAGAATGGWYSESADLVHLLGRMPTSARQVFSDALESIGQLAK